MHELGGTGMEVYRGVWWIGSTTLGNRDGFLLSAEGN